jgi:hypothetical protein
MRPWIKKNPFFIFFSLIFFLCKCMFAELRRWSSLSEGECQRFVSTRMVYWTSLRWCGSYVSYSPCILLFFKQTACDLTAEANVEQVFSRAGQLSEVNLDPDALSDMVSNMVIKLVYKISWTSHWVLWDAPGGKNSANKKTFSTFMTSPNTRTRTRHRWVN